MSNAEELQRENQALRDRLSRLSAASLRINESLDFETVLQGALDSACSLTGARYGVIALVGAAGRIEDSVTSGLTPEAHRRFMDFPEGMPFFEYLSGISEPQRLRDFHSYTRALGLPEFRPPFPVSSPLPFLAVPIRMLGQQCQLGFGYPVAISEAHEQAVISGHDREEFRRLTLMLLEQQGLPTPESAKATSKRRPWV